MKTAIRLFFLLVVLTILGCEEDVVFFDDTPPLPPTNISTLTGDGVVQIFWDMNTEADLAGYNVYWSEDNNKFNLLGSTTTNSYVDNNASNGVRTYYAVTAYDVNGNESELSTDLSYATPRSEGYNYMIHDYLNFPGLSGFSFAKAASNESSVVAFDDLSCDFFYENNGTDFYINVWESFQIKDMGLTNNIHDIWEAPVGGWNSELFVIDGYNEKVKSALAFVGHTYVIKTVDNHYAKIRVTEITPQTISFDWAYQNAEGVMDLEKRTDKSASINREKGKRKKDINGSVKIIR